MEEDSTKARILDTAQERCQRVGFNAFSYADIAAVLGITKASVHYHFPTKSDLGCALIQRYRDNFVNALQSIDSQHGRSPRLRLSKFIDAMAALLVGESRLCLCGVLASDFETLDEGMRAELRGFFVAVERWLTDVIRNGTETATFTSHGAPTIVAQGIVATLQGMLVTARTFEDPARFQQVGEWLLATLTQPTSPSK